MLGCYDPLEYLLTRMLPEQRYPQQEEFDFDRFFREHRKPLERFIASRVGATADGEDLASEVIAQLLAYCHQHPDRDMQHRALMYKIARNRIIDYYAERRAKLREIPVDDAPQIPAPGSIPASIDAHDELRIVHAALGTIREEYREVITLHAIVGLSASEIAVTLEKPPAHVRVLIFRARRALRKTLRQQHPHRYGEPEVDQS